MTKAVFLDKDGTLVNDKDYSYKTEEVEFFPEVFSALESLQKENYLLFIVSNQSGIGRGYYTNEDIKKLFDYLVEQFKLKGIIIKEYSYCLHKPEDNCECRKPKTKMVEDLIKKHNINREESFFVGDKFTDVEVGKNSNLKTILIESEHTNEENEIKPDFLVKDIKEAAERIANLK